MRFRSGSDCELASMTGLCDIEMNNSGKPAPGSAGDGTSEADLVAGVLPSPDNPPATRGAPWAPRYAKDTVVWAFMSHLDDGPAACWKGLRASRFRDRRTVSGPRAAQVRRRRQMDAGPCGVCRDNSRSCSPLVLPGAEPSCKPARFPLESPRVPMVEIRPLRIAIGREEDGRFLASVPELPGVMAYRDTQESALRKAKAIALQVLADMMESGEELPQPLRVLSAA